MTFIHNRNTGAAREASVSNHYQTPSGRFRRFDPNNQHDFHLPHQNSHSSSRSERLEQIKRLSYVLLLFIQGALCGLCIQTLYRVSVATDHANLVPDNENRRFNYMAITLALTGSLCRIEKSDTAAATKYFDEAFLSVTVYFVGLIMTLSSAVVNETSSVASSSSKGLEIAKSICGITGWLISCFQIYRITRDSRRASMSLP